MTHLFVIIGIFCVYLFLWTLWSDTKVSYDDVVKTAVDADFDRSVSQMDGYNDDQVIDDFERRWLGYIPKKEMHKYIGRLMEHQQSFLGVGS